MTKLTNNTVNTITINNYTFIVTAYKISHSENISKQFTVSGDMLSFRKGFNPLLISVKADCKSSDNGVISSLENALVSGNGFSFVIDEMEFSDMKISEYCAEKNKNGFINNISINFYKGGWKNDKCNPYWHW